MTRWTYPFIPQVTAQSALDTTSQHKKTTPPPKKKKNQKKTTNPPPQKKTQKKTNKQTDKQTTTTTTTTTKKTEFKSLKSLRILPKRMFADYKFPQTHSISIMNTISDMTSLRTSVSTSVSCSKCSVSRHS